MRLMSRVLMGSILLCAPVAANANGQHHELEVGIGLICNSPAQVERYLSLHIAEQAPEQAIRTVNDEVHDPHACALAAIAFVRGEQGKTVQAPGGLMKVTQVVVMALETPAGWQHMQPIVQFTAIFEKTEEA